MMHSTCWSHILHLVSEEIRGKLTVADDYIACLKSALVKAPSRREELLDAFEQAGKKRVLPPVPVITRWATWLEAGKFHADNFDAEVQWILKTEDNSAAVKKLKKLVKKEKLRAQLVQVADVCPGISSAIKMLECRSTLASDVWLQLQSVLGLTSEIFGCESEKLTAYLQGRHPSVQFWEEVQFCDPRKLRDSDVCPEIPSSLPKLCYEQVGIEERVAYNQIRKTTTYDENFCPAKFWKTFSRELPKLSKLCLTALSIPSSSADVERSFSTLRRILTPQRSCMVEANLSTHLRIIYNARKDCSRDQMEDDAEIYELEE
jgi:hypothetical protein